MYLFKFAGDGYSLKDIANWELSAWQWFHLNVFWTDVYFPLTPVNAFIHWHPWLLPFKFVAQTYRYNLKRKFEKCTYVNWRYPFSLTWQLHYRFVIVYFTYFRDGELEKDQQRSGLWKQFLFHLSLLLLLRDHIFHMSAIKYRYQIFSALEIKRAHSF